MHSYQFSVRHDGYLTFLEFSLTKASSETQGLFLGATRSNPSRTIGAMDQSGLLLTNKHPPKFISIILIQY